MQATVQRDSVGQHDIMVKSQIIVATTAKIDKRDHIRLKASHIIQQSAKKTYRMRGKHVQIIV